MRWPVTLLIPVGPDYWRAEVVEVDGSTSYVCLGGSIAGLLENCDTWIAQSQRLPCCNSLQGRCVCSGAEVIS